MSYKINIHAHSYFSDGRNSPEEMAIKAKELGFSALVLTDHFYNGRHYEVALVKEKLSTYKKALNNARKIIPVIRGVEIPFMQEEILVFGSAAIDDIIENNGIKNLDDLIYIRNKYYCAMILCHPNVYYQDFIEHVDGFERYNSGKDCFKTRKEVLENISNIQQWCNSDAHNDECLSLGYNIIDSKITVEDDLIKYIKSGKQHIHQLNKL